MVDIADLKFVAAWRTGSNPVGETIIVGVKYREIDICETEFNTMDYTLATMPAADTDLTGVQFTTRENLATVLPDASSRIFMLRMLNNAFMFDGTGTSDLTEFLGAFSDDSMFLVAIVSDATDFSAAIKTRDRALPGLTLGTSYIIYKAVPLIQNFKLQVTYETVVTPDPVLIAVAATQQLTVTTTRNDVDYTAATITYTSDDTAIATVDAAGIVTGVAAGTAIITSDVDGLSTDTVTVTVT